VGFKNANADITFAFLSGKVKRIRVYIVHFVEAGERMCMFCVKPLLVKLNEFK